MSYWRARYRYLNRRGKELEIGEWDVDKAQPLLGSDDVDGQFNFRTATKDDVMSLVANLTERLQTIESQLKQEREAGIRAKVSEEVGLDIEELQKKLDEAKHGDTKGLKELLKGFCKPAKKGDDR